MSAETIPGIGTLIDLVDMDGRVHTIKAVSIAMYSDFDEHGTETVILVGGRALHINRPRTEILEEIRKAQAEALGY